MASLQFIDKKALELGERANALVQLRHKADRMGTDVSHVQALDDARNRLTMLERQLEALKQANDADWADARLAFERVESEWDQAFAMASEAVDDTIAST